MRVGASNVFFSILSKGRKSVKRPVVTFIDTKVRGIAVIPCTPHLFLKSSLSRVKTSGILASVAIDQTRLPPCSVASSTGNAREVVLSFDIIRNSTCRSWYSPTHYNKQLLFRNIHGCYCLKEWTCELRLRRDDLPFELQILRSEALSSPIRRLNPFASG